ncbi:hypothetical protein ACSS6W_009510 [Trichoderma asperelloides]
MSLFECCLCTGRLWRKWYDSDGYFHIHNGNDEYGSEQIVGGPKDLDGRR